MSATVLPPPDNAFSAAIWFHSPLHASHHLVRNHEPLCGTAKMRPFHSWLLVKPEEMDTELQCFRCISRAKREAKALEKGGDA